MVFALAGDSTMTRDEPPAPSVPVSISVTVVFFFERLAADFLSAISVYGFPTVRSRRRETCPLDEGAKIIQGNPAVDLDQSPLNELLELGYRHYSRARQGKQLAPRLGSEATSLMWSKNSERHSRIEKGE